MPPLTSVVEVLVKGIISNAEGRSQSVEQVYHYSFAVPYSGALPALHDIADTITVNIVRPMCNLLTQDYTWVSTQARWLDDPTVGYASGSATAGSGTVATARMPSDITVRLQLKTLTRGKSFKGGKSYRPIPVAQVSNDTITAGAIAAWSSFANLCISAINVDGQVMNPCIVSRTLSQLRTAPVTITGAFLQEILVNETLGTLRGKHRKTLAT
jgi:hypothetical protein